MKRIDIKELINTKNAIVMNAQKNYIDEILGESKDIYFNGAKFFYSDHFNTISFIKVMSEKVEVELINSNYNFTGGDIEKIKNNLF